MNGFEQRCEVAPRIVRRLIVVHDLTEQLDFFVPVRPPPESLRLTMSRFGRIRSWPRVYGTTQNEQNSLQPSMIVT